MDEGFTAVRISHPAADNMKIHSPYYLVVNFKEVFLCKKITRLLLSDYVLWLF